MKNSYLFFLVKLYLVFFLSSISHSNIITPKNFIQEIVNDVKNTLVETNSKEFKEKKLAEIAKKNVDILGIGLYSLGSYRKQLNDVQKKEYHSLFEKYFLKSFTSRLSDYSDPEIQVLSADKKNENYTVVSSVLLATEQRPEVKIDWVVYTKNSERLLIRDLIIEGLKLARTQKEEFASIIESNDGNINSLFIRLNEFVNN